MIQEMALRLSKLTTVQAIESELREYTKAIALRVLAHNKQKQMAKKPIVTQDRKQSGEEKARQKSQSKKLISHLQEFGSITNVQAVNIYKVLRLSARIDQLRASGYTITCQRVRGGEYKYTLIK